ncbi:uncharacterized protein LOC131666658 isoform X2 [Phymastichus coffea]|uniref:uncharacterized protein LOC131666658 isoform X2 n=1 Tax=Phymastichus coffea TaxID=108790 RepID=UPI00273BFEE7|nr:uncharacterized protein LOC131666658 isoform X2 [Phymastichus coffea]
MYEESENNYLEGDVVWVKLGSFWWPGQVIGLDKLPEDVQIEFKKKPIIAAVKFFQEDSFEFVKNYHQIYKYNCAQKEDFIKKGLDKFRIKSKDHSNYMIKFPKDVKTAEILTNGDPNILSKQKFNPEEKPDVSGLFGEKKLLRKKRSHEEMIRKSNNFMKPNITHQRFIKENDHEIRIRKQPVNQLLTSNNIPQGIYPCELCGFTATRVNVIICHLKSHRLNGQTDTTKKKEKTNEVRSHKINSPKRKYIQKSITKNEISRLSKRKQPKTMESVMKKKKLDPELREKLLADWNVESDEDDVSEITKSIEVSTDNFFEKESNQSIISNTENSKIEYDNVDLLHESNKLLKETDNFLRFSIEQNNASNPDTNDNQEQDIEILDQILPVENKESLNFQKTLLQNSCPENENKRSQLSCFDFEEDDIPETNASNMKKIARGNKIMSIKKEIIKEFELGHASKKVKAFENANDELDLNTQDIHSSLSKKKEIKFKNENNTSMINSTKLPQLIETQVEIVEILEIQKEYEEQNMKIEHITEQNKNTKKDENKKLNYKDESILKMENSENFNEDNFIKEKNTIEVQSFLGNCERNISNLLNRDNECSNSCSKEQSSLVKSICDRKTHSDIQTHDNVALCLKDDLNIIVKKRCRKPKKILKVNNTTFDSLPDCASKKYNQKQNSSSARVVDSTNNEIQNTDKLLPETYITINDQSEESNKLQANTVENNKNVQEDSIQNYTSVTEQKSTKNDLHNSFNSLTIKKNEKNGNDGISNVSIDDFKKFEKQTSILDKESTKISKINNIELLPSETIQIKQIDCVTTEIVERNNNAELNMVGIVNEVTLQIENISAKDDFTSLSLSDNNEKLCKSKEEIQNELELNLENSESRSSNSLNLEKDDCSDNENNSQQGITCSNVNESVLKIQEPNGNCLNDNTVHVTKTFFAFPNLNTNLPVTSTELKSSYNIKGFDDTREKTSENQLLMEDKMLNQSAHTTHQTSEISNSSSFDETKSLLIISDIDVKQSSSLSVVTSSSVLADDKTIMPVKKREKPRIIENVALKEPMILKTKITEKHLRNFRKHKFQIDNYKSDAIQSNSKSVVTKAENVILSTEDELSTTSINKIVTPTNTINKVKIFQTGDSSLARLKKSIKNKSLIPTSAEASKLIYSHKYIQQNTRNLVGVDLNIDSMPLVLSKDVLTPESIEHIPVVMSTASFVTSAKQKDNLKLCTNDSKETNLSIKKKSGTPTILKSKNKVKPMITSIKTIMPPLTSTASKGGHRINTQTHKSSLGDQKVFGKYVIVQISGSQQAYSTDQMTIPTCKDSGNAQIVQQGGKVVILTSPQSPSQKILPISSIKALSSGGVKKMIIPQHPQQMGYNLTPNALETTDQKSIPQNMISKSFLMQCSSTVTKSGINTSFQNATTRNNFTETNAISSSNKVSISSKRFFSQKMDIFKDKPSKIIKSFPTGALIPSQGLVSKGTVLTPITGSQVKALAARNMKSNKKQPQSVEIKTTSETIHKSQKISSPSNLCHSDSNISRNMIVLRQNKNKQIFTSDKSTVEEVTDNQSITAQTSSQFSVNIHKKSKILQSNFEQKNDEKNVNYSATLQQSLPIEKNEKIFQHKVLKDNYIKNVNTELNKKLDHVLITSNVVTSKDLEKKTLSTVHKSSAMSISTTLSSIIDIPKVHHDQSESEKVPHENFISKPLTSKQNNEQANTKNILVSNEENIEKQKNFSETQVVALSADNSCSSQAYVLVTVDEQGNIFSIDNNTLMSIDAISNEKSRALYIDTNSLNESENVNNIILQIENGSLTNLESNSEEPPQVAMEKTFPVSDIPQTTNHDILAAALANTDFHQEIGMTNTSLSISNFTQTSLINQTILQSTIVPPTEPISSPLVLETSLTLNQPIMTPLEIPSNLPNQSELAIPATKTTLYSNELNTTVKELSTQMSGFSVLINKNEDTASTSQLENKTLLNVQCDVNISSNMCNKKDENISRLLADSSCPTSEEINYNKNQATSSVTLIDEALTTNNLCNSSKTLIIAQENDENNKLQNNEDQVHFTDASIFPSNASLQTVESGKSGPIVDDTQNTFSTSKNNFNHRSANFNVNAFHNSTKCINQLIYTSQACKTVQKSTKVFPSTNSIKSELTQNVDLLNANNNTNEDILIIRKSITPFEKLQSTSSEKLCSRNGTNDIFDSEIEMSNKSIEDKLITVTNSQEHKYKQLAEKQKYHLTTIIQEEKSDHDKNKLVGDKNSEEIISSKSYNQNLISTHNAQSNLQKITHPVNHEFVETDNTILIEKPGTKIDQNVEVLKSPTPIMQSYKCLHEIDTINHVPKISTFTKVEMPSEENNFKYNYVSAFSTQNFENIKTDNSFVEINTEVESTQDEVNKPRQESEINVNIIGTVLALNSNPGLNEDEMASSSYVPETPENQERDQDQESAISTSSYEILPCEELNIVQSNLTPDTSMHGDFSNIDNNIIIDMPDMSEIVDLPNSSCSLHSDSSIVGAELTSASIFNDVMNTESTSITNVSAKIDSHTATSTSPRVSLNYLKLNKKEITPSVSQSDLEQEYYEAKSKEQSNNSYYSNDFNARLISNSENINLQSHETTSKLYRGTSIFDKQCLEEGPEFNLSYVDSYSANYATTSSSPERHNLEDISSATKSTDR